MRIRFAVPVASAATAILMLGACSDDETTSDEETTTTSEEGSTTLATGDVTFAEGSGLGGQTMDITAVEQDGQVTGEARFSFGLTVDLQCADTDTDGLVILGGEVTAEDGDTVSVGDWAAVIIREGDPDSAGVEFGLPVPEGGVAAASCDEFLDTIPYEPSTSDPLADITTGDDIETG